MHHFQFTKIINARCLTNYLKSSASKFMKKVCVYCGSSSGFKSEYAEATEALGIEMVRRDIGLVYGGGSVGLMGKISSTVYYGGGSVIQNN